MKTTLDTMQEITDWLDDVDSYAEHNLRTDYSGTAMFDMTCVGWTSDNIDKAMVLIAMMKYKEDLEESALVDGDELQRFIFDNDIADIYDKVVSGARTDSMGRGMILYFPRITIDKEDI